MRVSKQMNIYWVFKCPSVSSVATLSRTDSYNVDARGHSSVFAMLNIYLVLKSLWFCLFVVRRTQFLRIGEIVWFNLIESNKFPNLGAPTRFYWAIHAHGSYTHFSFHLSNNTSLYQRYTQCLWPINTIAFSFLIACCSHTLYTIHFTCPQFISNLVKILTQIQFEAILIWYCIRKIHKQNYAIYALLVRRFDFSKQYHLTVVFFVGIEISRCSIFWLGAHVCEFNDAHIHRQRTYAQWTMVFSPSTV